MKPTHNDKPTEGSDYHRRLAGLLYAAPDDVKRLGYEKDVVPAGGKDYTHALLSVALADEGYGPEDL